MSLDPHWFALNGCKRCHQADGVTGVRRRVTLHREKSLGSQDCRS